MKRAVITKIGVVAPNGIGFENFSQAIRAGKSGLKVLDYFNVDSFLCRIAGQVPNYNRQRLEKNYPDISTITDIKVVHALKAFEDAFNGEYDIIEKGCACNLGTSLESFNIAKLLKLSPYNFDLEKYISAVSNSFNRKPFLQLPLDYFSNLIRNKLGLTAPAYLNCSACTASTQAIGHSFHMIRDGRYRQIITGGFDSMLNPLGLGGFSVLGALCTDNELGSRAIRPFDLHRKGTILGEGAAIFLLEELQHALSNGRQPLAEITGYGSSLDAYKLSSPAPQGRGLAEAMEKALFDADADVESIDYINAHGTGTPLNDSTETAAIRRVFEKKAESIGISSIKSMIGHTIGASGAIETAGIIAMMQGSFISPTINLETLDPACDLDYVAGKSRNLEVNTAVKNSAGFGGQNAVLVLKRYT